MRTRVAILFGLMISPLAVPRGVWARNSSGLRDFGNRHFTPSVKRFENRHFESTRIQFDHGLSDSHIREQFSRLRDRRFESPDRHLDSHPLDTKFNETGRPFQDHDLKQERRFSNMSLKFHNPEFQHLNFNAH